MFKGKKPIDNDNNDNELKKKEEDKILSYFMLSIKLREQELVKRDQTRKMKERDPTQHYMKNGINPVKYLGIATPLLTKGEERKKILYSCTKCILLLSQIALLISFILVGYSLQPKSGINPRVGKHFWEFCPTTQGGNVSSLLHTYSLKL